jgi:hypothetical protein
MDDLRLDRSQMLARLQDEFGKFQAVLNQCTTTQMLAPNVVGVWSVKDLVAHLVHWNRFPIKEIECALKGEDPDVVRDTREDDEINAEVVTQSRTWTVEELRRDFETSYQEVVKLVTELADDAFTTSGRIEQLLGASISETLANNTYDHYALHRRQLEAWLKGQ